LLPVLEKISILQNFQIDMTGKTIMITGANGGIGKETAKALALTGARIIMACRNMETANVAKSKFILIFC
jgi:NAD(P)-dependent dehydrogenase (short-subunit alcohol dehydrogenase family)